MDAAARQTVADRLARATMPGAVMLSRFRLLNEGDRQSTAFSDPRYAPFYYYLGQAVRPRTLVEVGFGLGLCSGCFLAACPTVEHLLGIQEPRDGVFYSPRCGVHNVRPRLAGVVDVVVARITDDAVTRRLTVRPWDMAIVNEERDYDTHLAYLEALWDRLSLDGSVVVDRVGTHPPARQAYHDFCRRKSREPYVFGTRYGAGIITK